MTFTKADLDQFCGTSAYHRFDGIRLQLSDGMNFVAQHRGAWLVIAIARAQTKVKRLDMQFWELRVKADRSCTLRCHNGDYHYVYEQSYESTDFPLDNLDFMVQQGILFLAREY